MTGLGHAPGQVTGDLGDKAVARVSGWRGEVHSAPYSVSVSVRKRDPPPTNFTSAGVESTFWTLHGPGHPPPSSH